VQLALFPIIGPCTRLPKRAKVQRAKRRNGRRRASEKEREGERSVSMEGNEHVFVQLVVTASSLLVCRLTSFRFRGAPRDAANLTSPRANPTYTLDSASPSESVERLICATWPRRPGNVGKPCDSVLACSIERSSSEGNRECWIKSNRRFIRQNYERVNSGTGQCLEKAQESFRFQSPGYSFHVFHFCFPNDARCSRDSFLRCFRKSCIGVLMY